MAERWRPPAELTTWTIGLEPVAVRLDEDRLSAVSSAWERFERIRGQKWPRELWGAWIAPYVRPDDMEKLMPSEFLELYDEALPFLEDELDRLIFMLMRRPDPRVSFYLDGRRGKEQQYV